MKRMLIVDDEKGIRDIFCKLLSEDYEISTAANGQEAIRRVREERPDLVTLDVQMPGIDGVETLRRIKAIDRNIPVIMVTGYDARETLKTVIQLGASDYIKKPFQLEEVKKAIEKVISMEAADSPI